MSNNTAKSISVAPKLRAVLRDARRVVVKVGTHAIATQTGRPDRPVLRKITAQICALRKAGVEVMFVSSGAVAAGVEALGLTARPADVNDVQMCAAVGQARYMEEYERLFARHGATIGQVLLTRADFRDRRRAANVRRMLEHLVRSGIVPVINENDVVSDEELKGLAFGDNDMLSALIANLVRADALVLLSTVDGLLDREGRRVPEITRFSDAMKLVRAGTKGTLSKGGMDSKLKAARIAAKAGASVVIADGRRAGALADAMAGRDTGTFIAASPM